MSRGGRRLARWCQYALLLFGASALICVGLLWLDANWFQRNEMKELSRILPQPSVPAAPAIAPPNAPLPGALLGRLDIPRIGITVAVNEGLDQKTLRRAAGHVPGTALPGDSGNVVIAAHRDTFFRGLRRIRPGDTIRLKTLDGAREYRVESTSIVWPSETEVMAPTDRPTLTLVTCYPFYYIGSAPKRFIVRAELTQSSAGQDTGRAGS
jgi:sortase A